MKSTTKIKTLITTGLLLFTGSIHAQRQMENLGRGVVAVDQGVGMANPPRPNIVLVGSGDNPCHECSFLP